MDPQLSGKVALVTGAASGLGKADSYALAAAGASVVLTDIDPNGQTIAEDVAAKTGAKTAFFQQDASDENRWQEVMELIEQQFNGLNILVNNAGIVIVATVESTTLDQFRHVNSIMSEGVFLGSRAAIPLLRKSGGGSIINISSIASHQGYPQFFAYSAAKGAIRSMTKSIAVHCQMNNYNIRCNSIHPGSIDTPMVARVTRELGAQPGPDLVDPVGIGNPEDVANLVVFLAGDKSRFINGTEVVLDNCYTIQ